MREWTIKCQKKIKERKKLTDWAASGSENKQSNA